MRTVVTIDKRKLHRYGVEQARERLRCQQAKQRLLLDRELKRALKALEGTKQADTSEL